MGILISAQQISKSFGARPLFQNLSFSISEGERVGLIGPNGCGKSTLLRILLGKESPDTGSVTHAESLNVSYFEQNRESLRPEMTLLRALVPSGDHVDYRGQPVHIRGYLDRFLFRPNQMELPVGRLSGGEQSRLLIARLMLKPANWRAARSHNLRMSGLAACQVRTWHRFGEWRKSCESF